VVAHAVVPGLPWASAFVLGAIVAPPDADVTTAIARRLGLPPRLVTLLEGETLLNDTTAFVSFRMAVSAAVVGGFSLAQATVSFVLIAAGGIAVGAILGYLIAQLRQRLQDPVVETTISLLTPFGAYLLAEVLGASGVLAVVTVGLCVSRFAPRSVTPRARVRVNMLWETVTFMLGGLVFTLIGLQLGHLAPVFWRGGDYSLLRAAALVSATVILVRPLWLFPVSRIPRLIRQVDGTGDLTPTWGSLAILGWAGLRGGDTLVMALGIPLLTESGYPFPGRETIVALAFGVIIATLLIQGLTLRPLIRWIGLPRDAEIESEERSARVASAHAALERLETIARDEHLPERALSYMRSAIRQRTKLDLDEITHAGGHDGRTDEDVVRHVAEEMRRASRDALVRLRDADVIGDEALRRVLGDLDLDDLRNTE
jgi:CPA1 family monovalent cation:H+ antiporter